MQELLKDLLKKQAKLKSRLEKAVYDISIKAESSYNKLKEGYLLNSMGVFQNITQVENLNAEYHQICEVIQMTEFYIKEQSEVQNGKIK